MATANPSKASVASPAETGTSFTVADRAPGTTGQDVAKMSPQDRHRRLMAWFDQEMRRQALNRFQMAMDEDYYDSMQWQPDEAAQVKDRGQNPVVYNEIKPMVDWLIGVERRTRMDFKVYSRDDTPEGDADAQNKTKLLKYLSDVNRDGFERSRAADDQFKAGLGWIEIGISPDPEDELLYKRQESWRNMLYDSLGSRLDLEDSRYLFRFRIVDLDVAIAFFPDKEQDLRSACIGRSNDHYLEWWNGKPIEEADVPMSLPGKYTMYDSDAWALNIRERVLLIECWHYEYTKQSRGGAPSVVDRVRKQMHCTLMTERSEILHVQSPYRHNKFPFVPYWCYRRKRDNAPYGPVRPVRGPQDSLNKRMSKALFVLSTNQTWIEKSAVDPKTMSADEVRDEAQAPDGFVVLADGGLAKVKTVRENDVAQGHLQLAQTDQAMIRNASGVSEENLNRTTSVQSGVALQQKDEQGSKLTAEIFDNMLFARQLEGEIELSLIEQFYDQPKTFSVAGERNRRDYVKINQPGPNGAVNDITARKAQFVIGEQAWKQNLQQAAFESMMGLLGKLATVAPQVVLALMDMVFELADIPNKQTVIQRIRSVTGFNDPDTPLSPQDQAAQAQKQQQQAMQQQLQVQQLLNDIKKAEAQGLQLNAQALKTRVESLYVAMQAAQVVATVPHVTPVADQLLACAGFQDAHPQATRTGVSPQPQGAQDVQPQPQPGATPGPDGSPVVPDATAPTGMPPGAPQPALGNGEAAGIDTPRADGVQQP